MKIAAGLLLLVSTYGITPAAQPSEGDPPSSATAPAATPQAATATQGTDAANKKQVNKVVLVDNVVNDQQLKQILAMGYRPEGHGDHVLYCRREAQIGTRFQTKTCRTSTSILEAEATGKDLTKTAQRDMGNSSGK
jgi:hypothetical protein